MPSKRPLWFMWASHRQHCARSCVIWHLTNIKSTSKEVPEEKPDDGENLYFKIHLGGGIRSWQLEKSSKNNRFRRFVGHQFRSSQKRFLSTPKCGKFDIYADNTDWKSSDFFIHMLIILIWWIGEINLLLTLHRDQWKYLGIWAKNTHTLTL